MRSTVSWALETCELRQGRAASVVARWSHSEETDSLGLEGLDGLDVRVNVISDRLERADELLGLINDCLVLENGTVVGKVDGGGLLAERCSRALGVGVALAEGLQRGDGLCSRALLC